MSRSILILLCAFATTASGQDSSFSRLRLRGALLAPASVGTIGDDWSAKPGLQADAASNVGRSELAFGVGRLGFDPTSAVKPPFRETLFSLSWTMPLLGHPRRWLHAGVRLTDVRMDFDDPSLVVGLRTEEETMIAVIGRATAPLGGKFGGFAEASYGLALHSTRTPMLLVAIGVQRDVAMPAWLRGVLR